MSPPYQLAPPRALYALLSPSRSGPGLTLIRRLLDRLRGFSRLSESVELLAQIVTRTLGLFSKAALLSHLLPQRGLSCFGDLQTDAKLRGPGRLFYEPVGEFADSFAATLRGNIRVSGLDAVTSRQLALPLPRIPERLDAIYGDEPAASYAFTFGFSFELAVLDVPADGSRRDAERFCRYLCRHPSGRRGTLAVGCRAITACTVLSHGPMLDPAETPRKPSDAILAPLGRGVLA